MANKPSVLLELFDRLPFSSQQRLKRMLDDQPELEPVIEAALERYQQYKKHHASSTEQLEVFITKEIKRYLDSHMLYSGHGQNETQASTN